MVTCAAGRGRSILILFTPGNHIHMISIEWCLCAGHSYTYLEYSRACGRRPRLRVAAHSSIGQAVSGLARGAGPQWGGHRLYRTDAVNGRRTR